MTESNVVRPLIEGCNNRVLYTKVFTLHCKNGSEKSKALLRFSFDENPLEYSKGGKLENQTHSTHLIRFVNDRGRRWAEDIFRERFDYCWFFWKTRFDYRPVHRFVRVLYKTDGHTHTFSARGTKKVLPPSSESARVRVQRKRAESGTYGGVHWRQQWTATGVVVTVI